MEESQKLKKLEKKCKKLKAKLKEREFIITSLVKQMRKPHKYTGTENVPFICPPNLFDNETNKRRKLMDGSIGTKEVNIGVIQDILNKNDSKAIKSGQTDNFNIFTNRYRNTKSDIISKDVVQRNVDTMIKDDLRVKNFASKINRTEKLEKLPGIDSDFSIIEDPKEIKKQIFKETKVIIPDIDMVEDPTDNEIIKIFEHRERREIVFKQNTTFENFITYCTEARMTVKDEKTRAWYISRNKIGILKHMFDRINKLSMDSVYHTLNVTAVGLTESEKLIVLHDVFMFVEDPKKILIYCYAVIKNDFDSSTKLGDTLRILLNHQFVIDKNRCKNNKLERIYRQIKYDLRITELYRDLEEYSQELAVSYVPFSSGKMNPNLFQTGLCLKLVCNFLDWDYTYNKFICKFLLQKIDEGKSPAYLYYLGVLGISALRHVGAHESTDAVLELIDKYLNHSELAYGAVAYLFLKQLKFGYKKHWLRENKNLLKVELSLDPRYMHYTNAKK